MPLASGEDMEEKRKITYWSKDKCVCPLCGKTIEKEVMLSGSGRMIAGELTDELHRVFDPSAKYGKIYPLLYEVGGCEECYAAFFWNDFRDDKIVSCKERLLSKKDERMKKVTNIFPYFHLSEERNLYDALGVYYLALLTYNELPVEFYPTIKSAIIALRLAWLAKEMNEKFPSHNFDYIADSFYRKATFLYSEVLRKEAGREEKSSMFTSTGPDIDKNYGWDGVVYLSVLLEYKYGDKTSESERYKSMEHGRIAVARLFGFGKKSKEKPGPLLEHARVLYEHISAEIKAVDE